MWRPAGAWQCRRVSVPLLRGESLYVRCGFKGNHEFRKKLLAYYKAKASEKENDYSGDTLWEELGTANYPMANGKNLTLSYMDRYHYPEMVCYLCRESVVYVFDREDGANAFMQGLNRLSFPEADVKLSRCFPMLKSKIALDAGKLCLIFTRKALFLSCGGSLPLLLRSIWPG